MTNEERAFLDEHHICRWCNKAKAFPGRKFCPECLERIAERNARAYAKPDHLPKFREYQRMLYHRRKDAGLCVRCGRPATHGMYCYEDFIKQKRRAQKQAEKRRLETLERGNVRQYRLENHLCYHCGAPVEDVNAKCCNACRERLGAILREHNGWKKHGDFKFGRELYEPAHQSGQAGTRAGGV